MGNTVLLVVCVAILIGFLLAGSYAVARVITAVVESVQDDP